MHTLLRSLFRGDPLGTAFDLLAETGLVTDDQAPEVMRWFRDWVGHGIFGSILGLAEIGVTPLSGQ